MAGTVNSRQFQEADLCRQPPADSLWQEVAHPCWPSTRRASIMETLANTVHREPWNKGKIVGRKAPFKLKDIWALRVRLQMANRVRKLALFNFGIDSKLRDCDLVSLKVRDICHGDQVASRAMVMQHKTERPLQFEITPAVRDAVQKRIKQAGLRANDFVFPSRIHDSPHLGTRGSTHESSTAGSRNSDLTRPAMARTR